MSVMPDTWIRQMAKEHGMIDPFVETQHREGVISYGLSSYGYDARVADDFRILLIMLLSIQKILVRIVLYRVKRVNVLYRRIVLYWHTRLNIFVYRVMYWLFVLVSRLMRVVVLS